MCYTCVRECPVKAIRITDGQAQVVGDRCIACGNCARVCSQHAKLLRSSIDDVLTLLQSDEQVAACLAPSFPAEFTDIPYTQLVGMIRSLGFHRLLWKSRSARILWLASIRKLVSKNHGRKTTSFRPPARPSSAMSSDTIPDSGRKSLAPIVSPMIAMARAMRRIHGDDLKVVFIGPVHR